MPGVSAAPLGVGEAILWTVAYADVFDFPLTRGEIVRNLIGCRASPAIVERALADDPLVARHTATERGYHFLRHRHDLVAVRERRARKAAELWPRAVRYGRLIARLPFVRMVAVTGALAVDNPTRDADLDYFVVTGPGRLWSARAETIVLVRLAAPLGDVICPNYFLSLDALTLGDRNLFTAHEVAQMVPLSGLDVYEQFRRVNEWSSGFLPNAVGAPKDLARPRPPRDRLQSLGEWLGGTPPFERFERWEMTRKVRRLGRAGAGNPEAVFSGAICKGHVDMHGHRILSSFKSRLNALGLSGFEPHWTPAAAGGQPGRT